LGGGTNSRGTRRGLWGVTEKKKVKRPVLRSRLKEKGCKKKG